MFRPSHRASKVFHGHLPAFSPSMGSSTSKTRGIPTSTDIVYLKRSEEHNYINAILSGAFVEECANGTNVVVQNRVCLLPALDHPAVESVKNQSVVTSWSARNRGKPSRHPRKFQ